jgi:hypothetical protein
MTGYERPVVRAQSLDKRPEPLILRLGELADFSAEEPVAEVFRTHCQMTSIPMK